MGAQDCLAAFRIPIRILVKRLSEARMNRGKVLSLSTSHDF